MAHLKNVKLSKLLNVALITTLQFWLPTVPTESRKADSFTATSAGSLTSTTWSGSTTTTSVSPWS